METREMRTDAQAAMTPESARPLTPEAGAVLHCRLCGERILPGEPWRDGMRGPEHTGCSRHGIAGGQGRSPADVEDDAWCVGVAALVLAGLGLVWLICTVLGVG